MNMPINKDRLKTTRLASMQIRIIKTMVMVVEVKIIITMVMVGEVRMIKSMVMAGEVRMITMDTILTKTSTEGMIHLNLNLLQLINSLIMEEDNQD